MDQRAVDQREWASIARVAVLASLAIVAGAIGQAPLSMMLIGAAIGDAGGHRLEPGARAIFPIACAVGVGGSWVLALHHVAPVQLAAQLARMVK